MGRKSYIFFYAKFNQNSQKIYKVKRKERKKMYLTGKTIKYIVFFY